MLLLLKSHFKDIFVFIGLTIGLVFFALSSWYIFGEVNWEAERFFLHYNIIFGVDRLGEVRDLWHFFFGALGVLLFNYFLSLFLFTKDKIISRIIVIFGGIWQIFMFIALYLIISLNS
jgi:hypothetical protein